MAHDSKDAGIGVRLRAARERAELSREALAVRAGISWSAIAQVESGRRSNLRPNTLSALASALDVTIDYLVSGRPSSTPMLEHRALIYSADAELLATAVPFIEASIEASEPVLVITSPSRIRRLRRQLGSRSKEVRFGNRATWYQTPSDALQGCRRFLDESLDDGAAWVRILGEPVWPGQPKGAARQWAHYESLLNLAFSGAPITVLCGYDTTETQPAVIELARATHPHILEHDELVPSEHYHDPEGFLLSE